MLERLVVEALFLDLAALVHRLHRAQHAAAIREAHELVEHGLLDELGHRLDDEGALERILVLRPAELAVDDHLDRERATHRLLGRRRDRLVVGVGVQAVAVVGDRVERLQRSADVVELDLLSVQGATAGLDVVLQLLRALSGSIEFAHCHGPDPARNPPDHRVLHVDAVAEEEGKIRRERVDVHSTSAVVLDEGEAVGEGEGRLGDRVRPGLCDVVARDGDRVEVPHLVVDEELLDVAHHAQRELRAEDAGVLRLVFFQDVSLHGATYRRERLGAQLGVLVSRNQLVTREAERAETQAFVEALLDQLIGRRVEEEGEDHGRGAVDRHRDRGLG